MARANAIYHNNFSNNTSSVLAPLTANTWDNGCPSGGNYWSDYTGPQVCEGAYQNVTGKDGVGDTPNAIDNNNTDHYPLMKPWYQILGDMNLDGKVSARS